MLKRLLAIALCTLGLAACALNPIALPPKPVEPVALSEAEAPEDRETEPRAKAPVARKATMTLPVAEDVAEAAPLEPLPVPVRDDLPHAYYPDDHRSLQVELESGEAERVALARTAIEEAPEAYPPYLYASLSEALLAGGERQEAAFWYYASQLRAKYDANRCNLSPVAERHTRVLSEVYGKDIARDALERPSRTAETIADVIRFDEDTPNTYDPRWVYYLPIEAQEGSALPKQELVGEAICQPEDRWPLIKDTTRMAFEREMSALIPGFVPARRTAFLRSTPAP